MLLYFLVFYTVDFLVDHASGIFSIESKNKILLFTWIFIRMLISYIISDILFIIFCILFPLSFIAFWNTEETSAGRNVNF